MPTEPTSDLAVLTRLVALAGRDVVDVGCGDGQFAVTLERAGARVTGVEVTEAKLSAARHGTDGAGVRFVLGRGEALPLDDGSQDVVVYLRSLHHVPVAAMDVALREARRVLRDGGLLYVAEPVPEGPFHAMVSLVQDETEVREAAQAALRAAGSAGLLAIADETYEIAGVYSSLEDVRALMVAVDPERAARFEAHRDELAALYRRGEPVADGIVQFRQPMRAELLRAGDA
jgi:ubiquinone/menaquinone biosynthesis C-methylase UbiE